MGWLVDDAKPACGRVSLLGWAHRLHVPDVLSVLTDRAVGGELATARGVHDGPVEYIICVQMFRYTSSVVHGLQWNRYPWTRNADAHSLM